MCGKTVAAPRAPQGIVYPILSEKSLHFVKKKTKQFFLQNSPMKKTKQRGVQKFFGWYSRMT